MAVKKMRETGLKAPAMNECIAQIAGIDYILCENLFLNLQSNRTTLLIPHIESVPPDTGCVMRAIIEYNNTNPNTNT